MKKYLIDILILTMTFVLVIAMPHSILAVSTNITSNEFLEDFDPRDDQSGKTVVSEVGIDKPIISAIVTVSNHILGVLQVIGGFMAVVSIAFYGFKHILSADGGIGRDLGLPLGDRNPNIRKELLDWTRVMLIGSLILFFSTTIVRIMFGLLIN